MLLIKHSQGLEEAVYRNIAATKELTEITRTSLGPNGINCSYVGRKKMVINHLEKLFVTSDAATIMRELDVVHPAAKLLVAASQQQESEVILKLIKMGDSTNFVIVLGGQLLQEAEYLLRMGMHAAEVIEGYRIALKKALEIVPGILPFNVELAIETLPKFSDEEIRRAVLPSICAKQVFFL
jgi:T-complex protein 1 subunit theta